MYYAVLAIEDGKIILENDMRERWVMEAKQIPFVVTESDVLLYANNCFVFDEEETMKRKKEIQNLFDELLHHSNEE